MICALAAVALLAAAGPAADPPVRGSRRMVVETPVDNTPPGTFCHGDWRGRCIRDGFLAGAVAESCNAELASGGMTVYLDRSVAGLTIGSVLPRCAKPRPVIVGRATLARRDRVARIQGLILRSVAAGRASCPHHAPRRLRVDPAALRDVLRETDGLVTLEP